MSLVGLTDGIVGEGRGKKPNHKTARKPGPLYNSILSDVSYRGDVTVVILYCNSTLLYPLYIHETGIGTINAISPMSIILGQIYLN